MAEGLQEASAPSTIKAFETLSILILLSQLILSGITLFDFFWIPIYALLVLSISRRASVLARNIYTVMFALGVAMMGVALIKLSDIGVDGKPTFFQIAAASVGLAASALQIVLVWLPASQLWFAQANTTDKRGAQIEL